MVAVNLFKRKPYDIDQDMIFKPPSVTVMIPARNEEKVIGAKIDNLLAQDYPSGELEILVVSDCSTDKTVNITESYADRGVKLIDLNQRHGKLGIVDVIVPQVSGDVVVITDANVIFAPDALSKMMRYYADPKTGAVCGNLRLVSPSDSKDIQREATYRSFEISLKRMMGRLGAVIGAYGGFYSQYKKLFRPLGRRPIHDDVIMPLEVLAQDFKVVFAEEAKASEETHSTIRAEYLRRVRMTGYSLNTIPRLIKLSLKAGFKVFYLAVSYKLLRWLCPYLFALLLISSAVLIGTSLIYNLLGLIFGIGILLALFGWICNRFGRKIPVATDMFHFTAMNFASFIGIVPWIKGVEKYWEPRGM